MQENSVDLSALMQVLDTSWGRSSTPQAANFSIKFKLHGDKVIATYTSVLNFGIESEAIMAKRREGDNAGRLIKQVLEAAKNKYKEATGSALKVKSVGEPVDSVDIVGHNPYNPKRTARFHRVVVLEVG